MTQSIDMIELMKTRLPIIRTFTEKPKVYFIYLLKCNDYYKIGYTINSGKRLAAYKTHNPYPVEVLARIDCAEYKAFERDIATRYASKHHCGEWYKLDTKDVQLIKRQWFEIKRKRIVLRDE